MALSAPWRAAIEAVRSNFSIAESGHDHLIRCWANTACGDCLNARECSWCPLTWSCIPNSYRIPLLAPAFDQHICPHPAERWEMRSRPLGCHVSSITSLTALTSVAATLVAVALLLLIVLIARHAWRFAKRRPDWRQAFRFPWRQTNVVIVPAEREPLLPSQAGSGVHQGA